MYIGEGDRVTETQRETDRDKERHRRRQRETEGDRERQRETARHIETKRDRRHFYTVFVIKKLYLLSMTTVDKELIFNFAFEST